jgi:alkylation response protein AidB-like acyl-CoA dehydrogenase
VVPIWQHGSEDQRRRYLPGLCDGTLIGVHAMTEPGSGSDAFALRTKAEPDGAGFRINGTKTFISNGPVADLIIVFAMTDPNKGYHGGVTAFPGGKHCAGFQGQPEIRQDGAAHRTDRRAGLRRPLCRRRRGPGRLSGAGSALFTSAMDWERICLFASHVGAMERLLEQSIAYARTRTQFGQGHRQVSRRSLTASST